MPTCGVVSALYHVVRPVVIFCEKTVVGFFSKQELFFIEIIRDSLLEALLIRKLALEKLKSVVE